jgi:hypothetical protein
MGGEGDLPEVLAQGVWYAGSNAGPVSFSKHAVCNFSFTKIKKKGQKEYGNESLRYNQLILVCKLNCHQGFLTAEVDIIVISW